MHNVFQATPSCVVLTILLLAVVASALTPSLVIMNNEPSPFVLLPLAEAHPFIDKTIPSTKQNAPVGTDTIIVFLSEPVEIDFSEIAVFDSKGNRVDDKNIQYYTPGDETAIFVGTITPLKDGVYTVSTSVLSKVDGHLVPGAFLFGVGQIIIDPSILDKVDREKQETEIIFLPEAVARFPGLVGQTIILGTLIASLALWVTQSKHLLDRAKIRDITEMIHRKRLLSITAVGLVLVLLSDIFMIIVHLIRLESSLADVLFTYFGEVWLVRLAITLILFGVWFIMNKTPPHRLSIRDHLPMIVISLVLLSTTSVIGHGAASGQMVALVVDYMHNLVAAVWIGGIIYLAFVLLPTLSGILKEHDKEMMSLAMIPRFSKITSMTLGIVLITGPVLLWMIESDVGLIAGSVFGQLIISKVVIASIMVGVGAFVQLSIQRSAIKNIAKDKKIFVHKKMQKLMRSDVVMGVAILGIVALLTNGTLPEGELHEADAHTIAYGLTAVEFAEDVRFDIHITPFVSGTNTIKVDVTNNNADGTLIYDIENLKVKVSNPSKNIPPIVVDMVPVDYDEEDTKKSESDTYEGKVTFGFSGRWLLEIEAQRTENPNESVILDLIIKPRLADLNVDITEFDIPDENARPLHIIHDGATDIWFSDAAAPRIWKFSLDSLEFTSYMFPGQTSTFLAYDDTAINNDNAKVWFSDTPQGQIGFVDVSDGAITTIPIPSTIFSTDDQSVDDDPPLPFFLEVDSKGDVWISIINKDLIARYSPELDEFTGVVVPGDDPRPFALKADPNNNDRMWYTSTGTGMIGYVSLKDNTITEIIPDGWTLTGPEALLFDGDGNIWITEHTGLAISRFDPILGTLDRYSVPNENALPFGMAFDRYNNIWFAQHTIDTLGVFDPANSELVEIPIPTNTSFVQFVAPDTDGNIWFAQQRAAKLGVAQITEMPSMMITPEVADMHDKIENNSPRYSEFVSPFIGFGIVMASLFFVKSVHDARAVDAMLKPKTSTKTISKKKSTINHTDIKATTKTTSKKK